MLLPFSLSVGLAWWLNSIVPAAGSLGVVVFRWVAIAAASSGVLLVVERVARRLLPIAALLNLALAFPDRAPSRLRIAMRACSTKQLQRRVEEAKLGRHDESVGEAAGRVIELVVALNVHDRITRGHSERVRAYSQIIASEMALSDADRDRVRWAGLLHDIGKLFIPASILNKKGALTPEEFEIVKAHPEHGRVIIEDLIPWLGTAGNAVWEHHERWDGGGYPAGLSGFDISLAARIVSVADAYDVMTSDRSYKEPISARAARAELARCAGSQFDPAVVRSFLNVSMGRTRLAAGPLSWVAQSALFPTTILATASHTGSVVLAGALGLTVGGVGTLLPTATTSRPVIELEAFGDTSASGPIEIGDVVVSQSTWPVPGSASAADPAVDPDPESPIDDSEAVQMKEEFVPDTTVPDTTVPDTTVPDTTVPDTTVPDTTVPDTTVPDTTVPDTTTP